MMRSRPPRARVAFGDGATADLADLLGAVASADRSAFKALYEATKAKLFGIILRIVYDRDDAAEVLQEVYLRIWRRAADYDGAKGTPMTWMITIARNRALDWRRRQRIEVPLDEEPWLDELIDDSADPQQQTIASAESRRLAQCLSLLDEDQQRCLILAYREGMTHYELAERLERPLGTIKSWIRRSLGRLKECLER
ncbi:MAG: sigma-70 family RNA polymerase sigma factor [Alphaproteobacteria bacterium]